MGNTPNTARSAAAKKAAATRAKNKTTEEQQLRERLAQNQEAAQREFEARVKEANQALEDLENTVTQREWLLITARLDRTRDQIATDGSLRLLALGWVKEKHDHGGANWDILLEMTDKELVRLHGFPDETPEETQGRLEANATLADADQAPTPDA